MGDRPKKKKEPIEGYDVAKLPDIKLPVAMDFCSPQAEITTRVSRFFKELKNGNFMTTKCKACNALNWPPRVVCPECSSDELEWVDLPKTGKLWAFTEMRLGAPLGFEKDAPFSIGVIDLDDVGIRMLTRIEDPFDNLELDMPMEMFTVEVPGDRIMHRFRLRK